MPDMSLRGEEPGKTESSDDLKRLSGHPHQRKTRAEWPGDLVSTLSPKAVGGKCRQGDIGRELQRREKVGPKVLVVGRARLQCPGGTHTQQLCVCSSQQLIEDMEVPLPLELLHHSGFLQQIWGE